MPDEMTREEAEALTAHILKSREETIKLGTDALARGGLSPEQCRMIEEALEPLIRWTMDDVIDMIGVGRIERDCPELFDREVKL